MVDKKPHKENDGLQPPPTRPSGVRYVKDGIDRPSCGKEKKKKKEVDN